MNQEITMTQVEERMVLNTIKEQQRVLEILQHNLYEINQKILFLGTRDRTKDQLSSDWAEFIRKETGMTKDGFEGQVVKTLYGSTAVATTGAVVTGYNAKNVIVKGVK
jgi:hypothetical protein